MSIIWINEDNTPVFAAKYWSDNRLWIGLFMIIVLSIIICFVILYYFRIYDKKQKNIKLYVEFGEQVTIQKEITPLLSDHVEHIDNIINIIYQFAAIPNRIDLDTIITSNMYGMILPIIIRGLLYILFLIIPYTIICHISLHIDESYRSFVDVPCVFVSKRWDDPFIIQFDLKPICNPTSFNLDDFIIYGETNFFELNVDGPNQEGYIWCSVIATIFCCCWCLCGLYLIRMHPGYWYEAKINENHNINKKEEKECLLTINNKQ